MSRPAQPRHDGPDRSVARANAATPMPPTPTPLAQRKATYISSEGAVEAQVEASPASVAAEYSSRRRPAWQGGVCGVVGVGTSAGWGTGRHGCMRTYHAQHQMQAHKHTQTVPPSATQPFAKPAHHSVQSSSAMPGSRPGQTGRRLLSGRIAASGGRIPGQNRQPVKRLCTANNIDGGRRGRVEAGGGARGKLPDAAADDAAEVHTEACRSSDSSTVAHPEAPTPANIVRHCQASRGRSHRCPPASAVEQASSSDFLQTASPLRRGSRLLNTTAPKVCRAPSTQAVPT